MAMGDAGEDVYCTLLMSDSYLPGATVLAKSLRDNGTTKKLAVLITPDSLLPATITELKKIYDHILPVERIANPNLENLVRLDRLDLRFAFTKITLWRQTQFRKIVYLDADVIALRAPDELFTLEHNIAAAPDIGWPDYFNSGMILLTPSMSEYWSLHTLAASGTSFDGADQGLLNQYFGNRPWHRLSFAYNCTPSASYQYEPAYRYNRANINMVHFIGKDKPWMQGRQALDGSGGVYRELLGIWWSTYDRHYRTAVGSSRTVQQYVKGEQSRSGNGWAQHGQLAGDQPPPPTPAWTPDQSKGQDLTEMPHKTSEVPFTENIHTAESIEQGLVAPTSTQEQRRLSAHNTIWDAAHGPPPASAGGEAQNFPSTHYEMSSDRSLYQSNSSYGTASNSYYTGGAPKPIFPWETNAPKPTRVFADDTLSAPPAPIEEPERMPEPAATESLTSPSPPSPPTPKESDPWQAYTRTNAWDDNEGIERYVRSFKQLQAIQRRGQVQVLHQQADSPAVDDSTGSPDDPQAPRRRESLILTDFPDADDRPSLPVTPAPIHRRSFWGHERDEEGKLPTAEGVPEQAEWDPTERLDELRRNSLVTAEELPKSSFGELNMPTRKLPPTSMRTPGASPPSGTVGTATSEIAVEPTSDERGRQSSKDFVNALPVVDAREPQRGRGKISTDKVGPFDEYSIA